jgi:hypothetical protein
MNDLTGQPAEVKMTVKVTRKDTGKVEEYELIGKVDTTDKGQDNGSHPQHGS